jgi:deazaflavin-dependent oxidoreductase (nitroreductase family)
MSQKGLVATPPTGLLRFLLRLPLICYRLHLGWLLCERFMLLRHIGRKSGQVRQTVVEVAGYDQTSDTYYVASGWGYKANWYQNLRATPDITIQVGRRSLEVHTETISAAVGAQILLDYCQKHPFAARELGRIMGLNLTQSSPQELEAIIQKSLPIVALQPITP